MSVISINTVQLWRKGNIASSPLVLYIFCVFDAVIEIVRRVLVGASVAFGRCKMFTKARVASSLPNRRTQHDPEAQESARIAASSNLLVLLYPKQSLNRRVNCRVIHKGKPKQ